MSEKETIEWIKDRVEEELEDAMLPAWLETLGYKLVWDIQPLPSEDPAPKSDKKSGH